MHTLMVTLTLTTMIAAAPGLHEHTITLGSEERRYLVYVPALADGEVTTPRPVVLAFHGGGGNARQMMSFSGLNDKAEEAGFLAVYPEGTGRLGSMKTWNAGLCCGYARRHGVDDVAYVRALLDDLASRYDVDPDRVFATGMSNGAMMCHRLGSELADRIAAIAPVAGTMGVDALRPTRPVPVVMFHGTGDRMVRFEGGFGDRSVSRSPFTSVPATVAAWVQANGCEPEPVDEALPDPHDDGTTVTRSTYAHRDGLAPVVLYTIHGGAHTWPGRSPRTKRLGPSTRDIDANDVMWEFFRRHPKPAATDG